MNLFPAKKSLSQKKDNQLILVAVILSQILSLNTAHAANPELTDFMQETGVIQAELYTRNPQTDIQRKFYYEIKPGDTINEELYLVNTSSEENNLFIYPVFNTIDSNGNTTSSLKDDDKKEISEWITFNETEVKLAPNEKKIIKATITIPENVPYDLYNGGYAIQKNTPINPNVTLNNTFRKSYSIEVNVMENPQEFVTKNLDFNDKKFDFKPTFLLWIAIVFFVISITYYLISKVKNKKKK